MKHLQKLESFWGILSKEFFGFINSPLAYLLLVPFLFLSHYLFLRTALVIGDANLRPFIEMLPWFLVIIVPALAMRTFSDEQKQGTLELLFSHPVSEWRILLGKYFGIGLYYGVILMTTIGLPMVLVLFSDADYGMMLSQYLGALLLGMSFLALSLMVSAYVRSGVGSFIVSAFLCFGLLLVGLNFVTLGVPAPFNKILAEMGVSTHIGGFSRGLVDVRDLAYFGTLIGIGLGAGWLKLAERRLQEQSHRRAQLRLGLVVLVVFGVLVNVAFSYYPLRLDLTANQRYSLSQGTRNLLTSLNDTVTITLYLTENLPAPLQVTLQETSDRLKDFSRYGGDRVRVETRVFAAGDTARRAEAIEAGIRDVNFNQVDVGSGNYQVQSGFLGLTVRYGDTTEVIPFVDNAANLEYQLGRMIVGLTRDSRPRVGMLAHIDSQVISTLNTNLREHYEIEELPLDALDSVSWDSFDAVVVIDDGAGTQATSAAALKQYFTNNGSAVGFVEGVSLVEPLLIPSKSTSELMTAFGAFGMRVEPNLVFDLQQNEAITLPGDGISYIVPYPFWVRSTVLRDKVPWNSPIGNVLLGWPSEVVIEETAEDIHTAGLLSTGMAGGKQTDIVSIRPQDLQNLQPSGVPITLAGLTQRGDQRVALVGDTQVLRNDFIENTQENLPFVMNLIDWVVSDEILSQIPLRAAERIVFRFSDQNQVLMVNYGALLIPPVSVAVFGLVWLMRRRRLTRRVYSVEVQS